jgi:hypothetical protein
VGLLGSATNEIAVVDYCNGADHPFMTDAGELVGGSNRNSVLGFFSLEPLATDDQRQR